MPKDPGSDLRAAVATYVLEVIQLFTDGKCVCVWWLLHVFRRLVQLMLILLYGAVCMSIGMQTSPGQGFGSQLFWAVFNRQIWVSAGSVT